MTPEQKREKEAKIASLAREVFVHYQICQGFSPSPREAFTIAEGFIEIQEERWEEAKK